MRLQSPGAPAESSVALYEANSLRRPRESGQSLGFSRQSGPQARQPDGHPQRAPIADMISSPHRSSADKFAENDLAEEKNSDAYISQKSRPNGPCSVAAPQRQASSDRGIDGQPSSPDNRHFMAVRLTFGR